MYTFYHTEVPTQRGHKRNRGCVLHVWYFFQDTLRSSLYRLITEAIVLKAQPDMQTKRYSSSTTIVLPLRGGCVNQGSEMSKTLAKLIGVQLCLSVIKPVLSEVQKPRGVLPYPLARCYLRYWQSTSDAETWLRDVGCDNHLGTYLSSNYFNDSNVRR